MNTLDRVKQVDIRDLLPSGVELGRDNFCRCFLPGHKDRTPSFQYHPENNSFICWGCQRGGSVVDLVMHMEGLDFGAALRWLADREGIALDDWTPEQEARVAKERRREEALAFAATYYAKQLQDNGPVLEYLKERGFTLETIKTARLGYANKQLLAVLKGHPQALTERGLELGDFIEAGLIAQDKENGRQWDYYRDRIVFPILKHGRVVHMSGRDLPESLGGGKSERKYLNLPAPLGWLYFEDNIRHEAYVCEGLPDTLSIHQAGFPSCGQQGTGGMPKHAYKFKRCHTVWCCFDTDGPGQEAAIKAAKAIHMALENGVVRIIQLPEAVKDLNDFFQVHTVDDFRELAAKAPNLIPHLVARLPGELPAVDKEREVKEILRLVAPLGTYARDEAIELIRKKFGGTKADLRAMLATVAQEEVKAPAGQAEADSGIEFDYSDTREIVPVQDFAFNSPAVGNYATFIKVRRKQMTDDGRTVPVTRQEAILVRVTHDPGAKPKVEQHLCAALGLTASEKRRIPFEAGVRGRWRTERRHGHSVERFVKGEVAQVSGVAIFQDICGLLNRYICFPDQADANVVAIYIMGTYLYRLFPAYGYMHLHGIRESGKSNVARIISELSFNSVLASNITGPVMFRMLQATCGTLIVDEAERLNNPKPDTPAADLMLMMNDGYKRGGFAYRADFNEATKQHEPVAFDIYSPKVFASIAELQYVLASRCIIIPCLRATSEELKKAGIKDIAQNEHRLAPLFADLRDRLHCWGLLAFPAVHQMYSEILLEDPTLEHLRGREREIWLPLLAIAAVLDNEACEGNAAKAAELKAAGALVSDRLLRIQVAKERVKRITESDESIELGVLKALLDIVTTGSVMTARPGSLTERGNLYVVSELVEKVTDYLRGTGHIGPDRTFDGRRLIPILSKTQTISPQDRRRVKFGSDIRRCVLLDADRIRSVIFRLGGVLDDEEIAS